MKKLLAIILMATLLFTGCGKKQAITADSQMSTQEISPIDIHSISYNPKLYTMDQLTIKRFLQIIENATPIQESERPDFKAGAVPYSFEIMSADETADRRKFSINNNILMEELSNGQIRYYLLDEKYGDYAFLKELCLESFV